MLLLVLPLLFNFGLPARAHTESLFVYMRIHGPALRLKAVPTGREGA